MYSKLWVVFRGLFIRQQTVMSGVMLDKNSHILKELYDR